MKIGVNYLLEAKELYEEGKIDFIDYFKLFSLNGDISAAGWCTQNKGLIFHGIIGGPSFFGNEKLLEKTDVSETKKILKNSVAPFISAHISSSENHSIEEYIANIKQNIIDFKKEFGCEIVLENVPYRDYRKDAIELIKPETISKIIYDNDIKFLFDISHARSAAQHFDMTLEEYVDKLPMERCVEVHLAGMFEFPNIEDERIKENYTKEQIEIIEYEIQRYGKVYDNHGKMNEEDYAFLEMLLNNYPSIEYVTLEYGSYNSKNEFKDEDYLYPVCNYTKVNEKAKEEVLEQLLRIRDIIESI